MPTIPPINIKKLHEFPERSGLDYDDLLHVNSTELDYKIQATKVADFIQADLFYDTLSELIAETDAEKVKAGKRVTTFANQNGAAIRQEWKIVDSTALPQDGGQSVALTGVSKFAEQVFGSVVLVEQFGAAHDPNPSSPTTDSTTQINAAYTYARSVKKNISALSGANLVITGGLISKTDFICDGSYKNPTVSLYYHNVIANTTGIITGDPSNSYRCGNFQGIYFRSVQNRIHTCFLAAFYRGWLKNCLFYNFDIALDSEFVYLTLDDVHFISNNKGFYPRPLTQLGTPLPSTMLHMTDTVFTGNVDGMVQEDRGLATGANNNLLSVYMERCGFEGNSTDGLRVTERTWYLTMVNCWTEANGANGVNITEATFVEINCRFDDTIVTPNDAFNYMTKISGTNVITRRVKTHFKNSLSIQHPSVARIIVKDDGTVISNFDTFSVTALWTAGVLAITFNDGLIRYPCFNVSANDRGSHIYYALKCFNTVSGTDFDSFGTVNKIEIECFDKTTHAQNIPKWVCIDVSYMYDNNPST